MADLLYSLQARVRQILGARGGPLIEAADFVQPVASIGTAEGPFRNPAVELGEGLKRQFVINGTGGIVVFEYGAVQLFTTDPNSLVHVRRIGVSVDGSVSRITIARTTLVAGLTAVGTGGNLTDCRQPITAIGIGGVMSVQQGTTPAAATLGFQELQPDVNTTTYIDVDYVVVSQANTPGLHNGGVVVAAVTTETGFRVSFEGELYTFGPGAR